MDAFAIQVEGMTKRFGERVAVDGVSLSVKKGDICGFLGPNGSGKTTFIRMLCGLLRADEGRGHCLGFDVITQSDQIKRHVGYMTQKFSFYEDLSIEENLDFVARMYALPNRKQAVADSLDRLGLLKRKRQLAGQLSGGWKQRLALAACMIHSPQLLLLDEPTAGVDPMARREFWEEIHSLASEGLTFLITTHYMDEAERCHRLSFISQGKLLANGSVAEVVAQSGLTTWEVSGPNLLQLAKTLRDAPGVDQAVAFGASLHVSGRDTALLSSAISGIQNDSYKWKRVDSGLEDVFIQLLHNANQGSSAVPAGRVSV